MKKLCFTLLISLIGVALFAQETVPFKTTAYYKDLMKKKVEILSEDYADMDGDNVRELVLLVSRDKDKKSFIVLKGTDDKRNYQEMIEYKLKEAFTLEKYEIDDVNGDKKLDLLIWLKDDSPDETGSHLIIIAAYGGVYKKIFEGSYYFSKIEGQPAGNEKVISYGEIKEGINLIDEDKNGSKEILIPKEKRLVYFGHTKPPTTVIYGGLYDIYRYKNGMYVKDENPKVVNFLTPIKVKNVEASSELSERPQKGVNQSSDVLNPAKWAADGNIGSSWSPDHTKAKKNAKDNIRFEFDGNQTLKAMIMIPGCMDTEDSWEPNNRITSFSIRLSNGTETQITRGKYQLVSSPVLGVIESPRAETQGAYQYMIYFEENTTTYSVEITIDKVEKGSNKKNPRTCISEVMFF
ncbi:MAG: hypothetical protein ACP5QK_12565 [Myxococcota bacterium]